MNKEGKCFLLVPVVILFRIFSLLVISPTEAYAQIGQDTFQAVNEIEECLVSHLNKSPEMLAGPPKTDTFVILCNRKVPCR